MRRALTTATFAALMSTAILARQAPQALQAPQFQGFASVEGSVVRAGSVPPALIPRARVVLSSIPDRTNPNPNPVTRTVATDESGHFLLRDIPAGNYSLIATRDGYTRAITTIGLNDTQFLTGVTLEMTPASAISGRIRNRAGAPLANVSVQAQRYTYREGRRILTPVQTVLTNDLGEFRLYYLQPGRYIVSARPDPGPVLNQGPTANLRTSIVPGVPQIGSLSGGEGFQSATATVTEFLSVGLLPASLTGAAYVSIYFPGTMDVEAATPIDLRPGVDFTGADFVVSEARSARIRGKIVNGLTGEPARTPVSVMLISRDSGRTGFGPRLNGTVAPDGTFEFRSVAPGSYDAVAMIGALSPGISFAGSGYPGGASIQGGPRPNPAQQPRRDFSVDSTGIRLAARVPITVRDADIEDLILSAQVGHTVKGRVLVEGRSAEESQKMLEGAYVQLQPDPELFETAAMPAPIRADGTFTAVGAIPGTYRIYVMEAVNFPPVQPYVKSVTLAGVDVISPRLVIEREPVGELEIVVASARGTAQVSVLDAKQLPAKSVAVVFIPDGPRRQHFDLYQRGQTTDTGTVLMSMPTGDYIAYAFENIEPNSWWDPEVMQKYAGQGIPVRIEQGGRVSVNLKLIPSP